MQVELERFPEPLYCKQYNERKSCTIFMLHQTDARLWSVENKGMRETAITRVESIEKRF